MTSEADHLKRRRDDGRVWPSWLSTRTRQILDRCGLEHPRDVLACVPGDFAMIRGVGTATLKELAKLYVEQVAAVSGEWDRLLKES